MEYNIIFYFILYVKRTVSTSIGKPIKTIVNAIAITEYNQPKIDRQVLF